MLMGLNLGWLIFSLISKNYYTFVCLICSMLLLHIWKIVRTRKEISAEPINETEEQLRRIDTLISGISHEFNNINAVIGGSINLILLTNQQNEMPESVRSQLLTIKHMIDRESSIINDLLLFGSSAKKDPENLNVLESVKKIIEELRNSQEFCELNINIDCPEDLIMPMNFYDFRVVLKHLISNAYHAIMDKEDNRIFIKFDTDKDKIIMKISDKGCGIEDEHIERIFDPFFSTKGVYAKSGTTHSQIDAKGLGLSVCQIIIKRQYQGRIYISSKKDTGTKVIVEIPKD